MKILSQGNLGQAASSLGRYIGRSVMQSRGVERGLDAFERRALPLLGTPIGHRIITQPAVRGAADYYHHLRGRDVGTSEIDLDIFSGRTSPYSEVVRVDSSMHRAAVDVMTPIVLKHLREFAAGQEFIHVADIASGAVPVTVDAIFRAMLADPRLRTLGAEYHAMDLQPAQIEGVKRFPFGQNVTKAFPNQGDAWDLDKLHELGLGYDWVTANLHLHHGTPKDIYDFSQHLLKMLKPGGLFTGHVVVMPDGQPYLRRPSAKPGQTPGEDMAVPGLTIPVVDEYEPGHTRWLDAMVESYRDYLRSEGVREEWVEAICGHIAQSDYPLSLELLQAVFERAGLIVKVHAFKDHATHGDHPHAQYFGVIEARRPD